MIIALGVPFLVIIMFLVKIYHTVDSSKIPFEKRGGKVFTEDIYLQDFEAGLPIEKAIYAVTKVRKETKILDFIADRKLKNKEVKQYQWLAVAVKDKSLKSWIVTFREKNITPKVICKTKVDIESGKIGKFECHSSKDKRLITAIQPVQQ
jgi:hypothetical protein